MSMMSEEQKIIDLENEISFLKDVLLEKQKEIEELKNNELDYTTIYINGVYEGKKYYKDKIREKIKEYDKWIKEGGDYTESLEAQKYALEGLLEEN